MNDRLNSAFKRKKKTLLFQMCKKKNLDLRERKAVVLLFLAIRTKVKGKVKVKVGK